MTLLPVRPVRRQVAALRAERDALRAEVERLRHDPLSGLLRREPWLAAAARLVQESRGTAVLFCDLDGLKPINDRYGHAAGDAVIAAVGHRMRAWAECWESEHSWPAVCGRLGGDEYVVALTVPPRQLDAVVAGLHRAVTGHVTVEGQQLMVRSSLGAAHTRHHGSDLSTLLGRADEAMYTAKRTRVGGGWYIAGPGHQPHPKAAGRRAGRPGTT